MQHYVVGFVFDMPMSSVLLIKKLKPEWQRGWWNGIGGKVEEGESPHMAMQRECLEESGLDIPVEDWTLLAIMDIRGIMVYVFYTCSSDIENAQSLTEERVYQFPVCNLPITLNVLPNLNWLVPLAVHHDRSLNGSKLQIPLELVEI